MASKTKWKEIVEQLKSAIEKTEMNLELLKAQLKLAEKMAK